MDIAALAKLLHETSEHHERFERAAPAHDWWDWYAAYLSSRQQGSSPDQADAAADRYKAEVKNVVVTPADLPPGVPINASFHNDRGSDTSFSILDAILALTAVAPATAE